jgi:hypothetical protein
MVFRLIEVAEGGGTLDERLFGTSTGVSSVGGAFSDPPLGIVMPGKGITFAAR